VGKHPTDRGKICTTRCVLTDGDGVPLGLALEGANSERFQDGRGDAFGQETNGALRSKTSRTMGVLDVYDAQGIRQLAHHLGTWRASVI
jgi:hypothetical protein